MVDRMVRVEAMQLRARATLASNCVAPDGAKLRLAEKMASKIEKVNISWSMPFANLVRAAVAQQRGGTELTKTFLADAVLGFERADMRLYAAAARRRLGETLDGERGRQLVAEADTWMVDHMVKNPEKMTHMLAPGFK